jgi:hypothetical protein
VRGAELAPSESVIFESGASASVIMPDANRQRGAGQSSQRKQHSGKVF